MRKMISRRMAVYRSAQPIIRNGLTSRLAPFLRKNQTEVGLPVGREIVQPTPLDQEEQDNEPVVSSRPPIKLITFIMMVVLPLFAFQFYYAFIASDQYIAEARFAVRSLAEQTRSESVDSSVISMDAATQDAHVVTSFIHSPALLDRIGTTIDYKTMFTNRDYDFWSRAEENISAEDFQTYWKKQVSAYIDGPSGIITLKVRTFSPEDSRLLAEAIINESEKLINELNRRAHNDVVASIRDEVERTGETYSTALSALNKFQLSSGLLSPEVQAKETGKLLTGLLASKLELETRLFVLKQSSAENSPAYEQLRRSQESIDGSIEKLRGELTGPQNASIASAILSYSKLETDRLVAEKIYETARSSYEMTLAASLRKALYLMVFVRPQDPQQSLYPNRISTPLIIGIALLVLWSTTMLLWAAVEDHNQ